LLIISEDIALFKHGIYQGGLPMVNMGDDSDISYVIAIIHTISTIDLF